jgi:CheY-like chemotaxis protein
MRTDSATVEALQASAKASQKVVIVNGTFEILGQIELGIGSYEMVGVDSNSHAYSDIKKMQPDVVILCLALADVQAFQVLSMLKLDPETRDIPVVTFLTEPMDGSDEESEKYAEEEPEDTFFHERRELRMN